MLSGFTPGIDASVPITAEPSEEELSRVVAESITSPHVPAPLTDSVQAENHGSSVRLSWVVGIQKYSADTARLRFEFRPQSDPESPWSHEVVLVVEPNALEPEPPPPPGPEVVSYPLMFVGVPWCVTA